MMGAIFAGLAWLDPAFHPPPVNYSF